MAEIVGLAASILALAGLAKTAIKFGKEARLFFRDFKTVRNDLRRAIRHVCFSAETINTAQGTLYKYCQHRDTRGSEVIKFIENEHVSKYMLGQSRHIRGSIRQLGKKLQLLKDQVRLWVTWQWRYSLRNEIEELRVQMQFIQVSFTLLLEAVQLEIAMTRIDRDEILM